MGIWVRNAFALSLLLFHNASGSEPLITVRLNDQAGVPGISLDKARREAARIFGKAGVPTRWLDCPAVRPWDPACDGELTPSDVVVRMVRGSKPGGRYCFGSALAMERGEFGNYATIYYGAVAELAKGEGMVEGLLLGYAIAHEVGHLLLGRGNHSPTGIMTARWTERVLRSVPKNHFLFTQRQVGQLRAEVLERSRASSQPTPIIARGGPSR